MNCLKCFNCGKKRKNNKNGDSSILKKLSIRMMTSFFIFSLLLSYVPAFAADSSSLTIDDEVHYTIRGEVNYALDYARTDFAYEDGSGIHLNVTKRAKFSHLWGNTKAGPYNGRYILNFFLREFYTQIESVSVNGVRFEKEADGALWKVAINDTTFKSLLIGVITNHDVVIKLKNGASLNSLGLANVKISFTTVWVRGDGYAELGGYDNGFILKNNPYIKPMPADPRKGNEYYLPHKGSALNVGITDGTKSSDGLFSQGSLTKVVYYDAKNMIIKSTVSFKPQENFRQCNSGWVLYINEVIPQELLKYIDTNNVYLGVSDSYGNFKTSNPLKIVVDPNGNGHISTKDTPELSIIGGDWDKVEEVRDLLADYVFSGLIGQRRSYTIQYNIKPQYNNVYLAAKLNEYIKQNKNHMNFESWLEADFVDYTDISKGIRYPDGGKANKMIYDSYANGFLEIKDTDKDGLYDFVEDAIGSNKFDVDTDGDGVPDNVEVLTDNTSPVDATSYLVVAPILTTTQIEPDVDRIIFGSVPKTIYNDPANPTEQLVATNEEAGNVIVKAFLYVEGDTDYSDNEVRLETKIPFADLVDGNFELHVPANTFNDEDRIVVVAYAPNGKYPMISDKTVLVGTLKVTFKTNGGIWSDGTNEDKKADIINGTATQPEVPQRKGFIFLGWASTADAQAPETGILTNLTDPKDVYAVWKVIPSYFVLYFRYMIENKEQTVIDGKLIDDVVIVLGDPAATITVETDKLPNDVSYDENTKTISGVANVTDWEKEEEVRIYEIGVIIENSDGSKQTETVKITVLRDTDGDGQPDIEDEDDDNDGFTDIEEDDAGTDPKDPDSIPEALQDTGPNDDLPNAGDNTNIVVPLSLALISGLLILLIILKEKKEDKETILN